MAAALLGRARHDPSVEPLLESLVDSGLLESPAPGHYRYHPLIRLYARRADHEVPDHERASAPATRLYDTGVPPRGMRDWARTREG